MRRPKIYEQTIPNWRAKIWFENLRDDRWNRSIENLRL